MVAIASSGNAPEDPREFASRKVLTVLGVPVEEGETIQFWMDAYLSAAVRVPDVRQVVPRVVDPCPRRPVGVGAAGLGSGQAVLPE